MTITLTVNTCFAFSAHGPNYEAFWQIIEIDGEDFKVQKWQFNHPAYPPFRVNRHNLHDRFRNGEFFTVPFSSTQFEIET